MQTFGAFLMLWALISPWVAAQDKAAVPTAATTTEQKIDANKETDIRKLLSIMGTAAVMQQTMLNMEKNVKPMVARSLPEGEYRDKLVDLFFERFHAKLDTQKLVDLAVPVYDKYFSDEDIKGLIQFYQTPLGQKTVKALPQLTAELTEAGQQLGGTMARESMLEVIAEHPELEKAMEEQQKPRQP
jgi:hypothetical protein